VTQDEAERQLGTVIARALADQKERVWKNPDWPWEDWLMAQAIGPVLEMIAMEAALVEYQKLAAKRQLSGIWERVKAWVSSYLPGFVRSINQTSWQRMEKALQDWMTSGETLGELELEAALIFGPSRAAVIAVTEATRAFTEGNRAAADELIAEGWNMVEVWHTNRDGLVCELCGPLDGEPIGEAWERGMGPPLHPNCRCWTTFELVAP